MEGQAVAERMPGFQMSSWAMDYCVRGQPREQVLWERPRESRSAALQGQPKQPQESVGHSGARRPAGQWKPTQAVLSHSRGAKQGGDTHVVYKLGSGEQREKREYLKSHLSV